MTPNMLVDLAKEAMKASYSPYSHFTVGAALLCQNGNVYTGCNIENASYTPTICAERTAFFKAISQGERNFVAIAIVGGANQTVTVACPPCGVCRQVMAEFCDKDHFMVYLGTADGYESYTLHELLPHGFYPSQLKA